MNEILHITTEADWSVALATGRVAPASLAEEGFVHCSTRAQVPGVVERFYADVADLVLLVIDGDAIDDLRWEPPAPPDGSRPDSNESSERFPHVYGPIPVATVRRVDPVT